tara:strand:+ start:268 stop:804 length:537 start_codon:yes stop_codon:yes gene_type:complete
MDSKTLFGALLVAGIIGGIGIYNVNNIPDNETLNNEVIEVGNQAPDFTLRDTEGNEFNLSDYQGEKVLVLEFMNMGCGSCHNFEKNVLKSYCNNTTMPKDVEVVSITQTEDEDENKLFERAEDKNWAYALGSEKMTETFGAERSPTIVIIDKEGIVTFLESGSMSKSELEEKINKALE